MVRKILGAIHPDEKSTTSATIGWMRSNSENCARNAAPLQGNCRPMPKFRKQFSNFFRSFWKPIFAQEATCKPNFTRIILGRLTFWSKKTANVYHVYKLSTGDVCPRTPRLPPVFLTCYFYIMWWKLQTQAVIRRAVPRRQQHNGHSSHVTMWRFSLTVWPWPLTFWPPG